MGNSTSQNHTTQPATPTDSRNEAPTSFPTPAHPFPRFLTKRIAIFALLFIILIFGFGIYNVLNTNQGKSNNKTEIQPTVTIEADPTANWKTLVSKTLPITLEYPAVWQYIQNTDNTIMKLPYAKSFITPNELLTDGKGCAVYIGAGGGGHGPTNNLKDEAIIIDNKPFTKRTWYEGEKPIFMYLFPNTPITNADMLIWAWPSDTETTLCQKTIDDIFSTLKFTNQLATPTQVDGTATWDLYKDTDYPFQIKYPKTWFLRKTYGSDVQKLGPTDRVSGIDIIENGNDSFGSVIVINIIDPKGNSFADWLKLYSGDGIQSAKPNYTFLTYPAVFLDKGDAHIYFQYKDKIIFVAYRIKASGQKTIDQILSAFKFLDQEESSIDLPPLYPRLTWEATKSGKFLFTKSDGSIVELKGYRILSEVLKDPINADLDLFNYYNQQLLTLGWKQNEWAAAGGPDGSQFGYEKKGKFIDLGYTRSPGSNYPPGPRAFIQFGGQ